MESAGAVVNQIVAITRREPHVLHRTRREVRSSLRGGRAIVRGDGRVEAFLFYHVYGRWAEIGTGWVAPENRRRGVFVEMHEEILEQLHARGLRAFGFPGSAIVEHAMVRMGFQRAPLSTLPPSTWLRFVATRLRWSKARSYWKMMRAGAHRTSTRLYVFLAAAGDRPVARA